MDGIGTVGPPGPRGPPGRVEVLSSVSTTQFGAWPIAFCFSKVTSRSPVHLGLQGWWLCRVSGPVLQTCSHILTANMLAVSPQALPPPCYCSPTYDLWSLFFCLAGSEVRQQPRNYGLEGAPNKYSGRPEPVEKESPSWRHQPDITFTAGREP